MTNQEYYARFGSVGKEVQYQRKNRKTSSTERFEAEMDNYVAKVRNCAYEGSIVIKGNFNINVLDRVVLDVKCKNGSPHYISGTYEVIEKTDLIEGDFTTTLKLFRVNAELEDATLKFYSSGRSGNYSYKTSSGYRNYTSTMPIIHGSGAGVDVVNLASQYLGYPYVWGGANLETGVDCSHFVWRILQMTGRDYGYHTSYGWRTIGEEVPPAQAETGDVFCYNGHVAFFIDGNHIIHARGKAYGIEVTATNPWTYHGGVLTVRRLV